MMDEPTYDNTGQVIDTEEESTAPQFYTPTENDDELTQFVIDHTDRWRDYRDQNFMDDWDRYERIFRGKWSSDDKIRESERSRIISPATQQAVETRHAEIMEAIFGQGDFFDIKDDLKDQNGRIDVEVIKAQLNEDFKQDKIRKAIDQIELLAEIYGTGIGEVVVSKEKFYYPEQRPIPSAIPGQPSNQVAYGVTEQDRVSVKLVPVNPKNFLFDPNGTSIDDCMGVAIEKYVSIHKIAQGIASGKYLNVDIGALYESDELEPTQETKNFEDDKVKLLTYYGLVPREYLADEEVEELFPEDKVSEQLEDYSDMVEAIIVIANGSLLLKKGESPYMMKDRPVLAYQDDTVPNRLLGRGTVEKAYNMQCAIDGSMRSHMDALALTVAPMVGIDATRLPRGAKFEVKPGKAFLTNGAPNEILYPFNFGTNDGAALTTSKEFERMLLMATGTIDSQGQVSQVSRDGQLDMATATIIKKYKRTLVNFQEDFLIPFIKKAAWRYMQFDPQRYPSVDVKFIPTGGLGIIAREYEQKQLAFMIQTLGAQSPLTPILMQAIIENSALPNREALLQQLQQMQQMNQPNPQQQQMQQMALQLEAQIKQAEANLKNAQAQKAQVEAQLAPDEVKAKIISALSNNLDENQEGKDFERRAKIAELMLKEKDIDSNERIAKAQMAVKAREKKQNDDYISKAQQLIQ
jgi:hypothetical protein